MKFVGIKKDRIQVVSDRNFKSDSCRVMELPEELSNVSVQDLISDYKVRDNKIVPKISNKLACDMKVALVGNWKMRCGISTYSEQLWPAVAPKVGHVKLFIEHNSSPTGDVHKLGATTLSDDQVVSCWNRGGSLKHLTQELKTYDPDIIWIQHEFGLWSNASYWLSFMNQISDYRRIITMHSVFHHKDKTICEAAMPEIITHLQGGYDTLKLEKCVPGKVYVVSHGCTETIKEPKLWNYYKSTRTFMQFGFGFRYKGWENSIRATALLKQRYPDVFFTGLFSESPFSRAEHQLYYDELMDLVEQLGIQENVALLRGFQSDESLDSFLRTNQAVVFPYVSHPQHEVFGASGAARLAFSKGVATVSSNVNHFSDIPTIKAETVEELSSALESVLTDQKVKSQQIVTQNNYVKENSWDKVADRHIAIFENKYENFNKHNS